MILYFLTYFLMKISLVLSSNSSCTLSDNNDICENIILLGGYIHAGTNNYTNNDNVTNQYNIYRI